ncbi:molybdopterin molybdotransferase MoeA [Acidisoma sp. 7E03]
MISVAEARARILAGLAPLAAETVPLAEALHRVTAAPVVARLSNPPGDVSAMDGYAVRAADAQAGTALRLIGAAPAGHPFAGTVGPGEAVRLFTGSLVPKGADTILIQENARAEDAQVTVREAPAPGRHIRRMGQDFMAGQTVLPAGTRLSPRHIGLAAAAGHPWITVHRRPRVTLLCTGDEIALPGEPLPPGGVVSSNGPALAAFLRAAGAEPTLLPTVPDRLEAIAAAAEAARGADMLVTTGGASVGDHDLVQAGLAAQGLTLDFWRIAMRPGKPLMHGRLGPMPMLGLPGNPVSALVCAILFLLPALEKLQGLPGHPPMAEPVRLASPLPANDMREDYVRASLLEREDGGGWLAHPYGTQDSGQISRLAAADALLVRPPLAPALGPGDMVPAIRLAPLGL